MVIFNILEEEGGEICTLYSTDSLKKAKRFFSLTRQNKEISGSNVVDQKEFCEARIKVDSKLYDGDILSFLYANDTSRGAVALKCDMQ